MFKKILFSILLFFSLFLAADKILAAEKATIYFFWGDGCPHCAKEEVFLDELKSKYPQIEIRGYEVWKNAENQKLLAELGKKMNIQISGVPFTIIGEKYFTGWFDRATTGRAIEEAVNYALNNDCRDIAAETLVPGGQAQSGENCAQENKKNDIPDKINVPIFGAIEVGKFSLPVLTIVLGGLDGFNPCAMWTLLFLISLLLGMQNRRRMWILGGAFIIASAAVYFSFMVAWLNLILFIGLVFWVRLAVAGVSLAAGGYNLKKFFSKQPAVCKTGTDPMQQEIFRKLKAAATQRNFYLALGGIILLAFAVNLVELICSAGFPVIFMQILAMSGLSWWQHYLYILLYIFVFMADDMIVFIVAMATLKMAGVTTRYQRFSYLAGGVLMAAIGLLLVFKPEWLMFG